MTFAGDNLEVLATINPKVSPMIEYTIGDDFDYSVDGGALSSSVTMGKRLSTGILGSWKNNNYVSNFHYANRGRFDKSGEYTLILEGRLDGESNIILQILSSLTLFVIPFDIDASANLTFKLENTITGEKYVSKSYETINQTWWIVFLPALPFMYAGENDLYERMSEHVYQDFVAQGAFN